MYLAISSWITVYVISNLITYKRKITFNGEKPLQDVFHTKYLPDLRNIKILTDFFPLLSILLIEDYNGYIWCHTTLILFRFICFNSTIVPPPMNLELRMSMGIIPNFNYDLIFSGHVMTTVLSIYFTNDYYYKMIVILFSIISSFLAILTREQYTIDVIVAWIATYNVVKILNY